MKFLEVLLIKISIICIVFGTIFFILHLTCIEKIGGDATSGYIENGHYYVKEFDNAGYKEITSTLWYIGYSLSVAVIVFFTTGMLGAIYLLARYVLPLSFRNTLDVIGK